MKKIILAAIILVYPASRLLSQGCSDAGVCTIHSIKNNTGPANDDNDNDLALGFAFGKGERNISYYTPYVQYTRSLNSRTSLTAKASFAFISGELANTNGLSDLFVSVNHAFDTKGKWQKSFIAGIKVPFDQSDIIKDGKHLPMPYQTSLGTTDLVLGVNYIRNDFGITLAIQQPLTSTNGNHFLPESYPANSLAQNYLPTNEFSRKGDVLLRFSYNYKLAEKLSVRPSLLGIYHEANDTYLDANKVRMKIPNSNGLTLNGNIFLDYAFNNGSGLELSIGAPFIIREKRPDGLTRSVVASVEYKFSF
jgi:hypothetical protein